VAAGAAGERVDDPACRRIITPLKIMLIKQSSDIAASEITDKSHYLNRRQFLSAVAMAAGASAAGPSSGMLAASNGAAHGRKLINVVKSAFSVNDEKINSWVQPTSRAKFVEFTSVADPKTMPGVRNAVLNWPYREGLRMDEAMHPLTLLVVGLYGEVLPASDGAPLRLAVPWKYGFKHAKSIVRIRFVEKQPINSWQQYAANEYGFYANVNPTVEHPRWSQTTERRIGEFFRRKTLMFNGYADRVQSLYAGMDLRRNY
jgi:hypothetical protein